MTTPDIQYIETGNGKRLVVIDEETFEAYREAAEELEDIRLYNQAKADDEGSLPAEEAFKIIEQNRTKTSKVSV